MTSANVHKIPQTLWKSFKSPLSKKVFNQVYSEGRTQKQLNHPKSDILKPPHWKTLRHNFATLAAWAVDENTKP